MLTKVYKWKELSDDGLLKEPKEIGAYYSTTSFNNWGGFASMEDAIKHLEEICKNHKYGIPDLILIEEYHWRSY